MTENTHQRPSLIYGVVGGILAPTKAGRKGFQGSYLQTLNLRTFRAVRFQISDGVPGRCEVCRAYGACKKGGKEPLDRALRSIRLPPEDIQGVGAELVHGVTRQFA
jgi:hypothetical protein